MDEETDDAPPLPDDMHRDEWLRLVFYALMRHPSWLADTVNAAQEGILATQDRQMDRISALSLGLWEALRTKPTHKRRDHEMIIAGIKASTLYPSKWTAEAIERESAG